MLADLEMVPVIDAIIVIGKALLLNLKLFG
jgi:hypothetical protein